MKNNNENVKLKPCPFCRNDDIKVESGFVKFGDGLSWRYNMVGCKKCGGVILVSKDKDAIEAWNKRIDC